MITLSFALNFDEHEELTLQSHQVSFLFANKQGHNEQLLCHKDFMLLRTCRVPAKSAVVNNTTKEKLLLKSNIDLQRYFDWHLMSHIPLNILFALLLLIPLFNIIIYKIREA